MAEPTPSEAAKALDGYVPFPDAAATEYVEEGFWENEPLHAVLDRSAERRPDHVAVTDPDRELTYRELVESSESIAALLAGELGIERLDRVAFQLTNRVEFVEALFACSRIGAVPVMLLPRHREAEIRHVLGTMDAKAYLTVSGTPEERFDYVGLVEDIADEFPNLEHLLATCGAEADLPERWREFADLRERDHWTAHRDAVESIEVVPSDPGLLLLSGGTTGLPKGIPRTHNDYGFQWRRFVDAWGVHEGSVGFPSAPIGHNASLVCIVGPAIRTGATVACTPELKPESLMELIEREGGTYSLPIPTQLVDILEHPRLAEYDLSSLEVIISGGQRVPPRVVYEFVDRWDVGFGNIFGMAEGPIITTRPEDDVEDQAHTVGRPLSPEGDAFRLVDPLDREGEVETGETGELAARGPGVFRGYFRESEENDANFDGEGWFYTEDLLSRRADGYFEVRGRKKETIIRGGENIHTPGVESVIVDHPKVADAAVIGKPDERLGEQPYAFVTLVEDAEALTLDELVAFLDEQGMAVFKRPEFLEVVEEFPRTGVQKIDKQALEERVESE